MNKHNPGREFSTMMLHAPGVGLLALPPISRRHSAQVHPQYPAGAGFPSVNKKAAIRPSLNYRQAARH